MAKHKSTSPARAGTGRGRTGKGRAGRAAPDGAGGNAAVTEAALPAPPPGVSATAPATTAPATTSPATADPATTSPVEPTAPATTAPAAAEPEATAPATAHPETTAPATTHPEATAPATTEPTKLARAEATDLVTTEAREATAPATTASSAEPVALTPMGAASAQAPDRSPASPNGVARGHRATNGARGEAATRGLRGAGGRVAVVAGLRTPFARQGTAFRTLTALDLGRMVVAELLERTELDPREIDQVVFGQVVPSIAAPNIAREIVLGTRLDPRTEAYSVSRACATSLQAIASAAESILAGTAGAAIAGGADSTSDVPITVSRRLAQALVAASRARSLKDKLAAFRGLALRDLVPVPPAPREPSTGLTMGEAAEKMAHENGIGRDAQDDLAHRSHTLAARAWAAGKLDDEVLRAYVPPAYEAISRDNNVREGSDRDAYRALPPAFDPRHGTVTAANSSPLTDGAAAVLLMSEDRARALGVEPLGYLRSWAFAALDPRGQMLMGPSYASPLALDRAGLPLREMDLVDMHEAFAAQVLSNLQAFASRRFAEDRLGRAEPVGEIDLERFNVLGGSLAVGHPFAATAARMVTSTLRELRRRGGQFALVTLCAAGGLGAAAVLEAA